VSNVFPFPEAAEPAPLIVHDCCSHSRPFITSPGNNPSARVIHQIEHMIDVRREITRMASVQKVMSRMLTTLDPASPRI